MHRRASSPSLIPAVTEGDPKTPGNNRLQIVSVTMQPGEELIVGRRLREIPGAARKSAKG
jgi:hypothetical protein